MLVPHLARNALEDCENFSCWLRRSGRGTCIVLCGLKLLCWVAKYEKLNRELHTLSHEDSQQVHVSSSCPCWELRARGLPISFDFTQLYPRIEYSSMNNNLDSSLHGANVFIFLYLISMKAR